MFPSKDLELFKEKVHDLITVAQGLTEQDLQSAREYLHQYGTILIDLLGIASETSNMKVCKPKNGTESDHMKDLLNIRNSDGVELDVLCKTLRQTRSKKKCEDQRYHNSESYKNVDNENVDIVGSNENQELNNKLTDEVQYQRENGLETQVLESRLIRNPSVQNSNDTRNSGSNMKMDEDLTEGLAEVQEARVCVDEGIDTMEADESNKKNCLQDTDAEDGSEPSPNIMRRSSRCRKVIAITKEEGNKGRGRPRNTDIPEPVVDDSGQLVYVCQTCHVSFKKFHTLIVHNRIHTGSRPFRCPECGKCFTTKGNMQAHERVTHSDSKPWKCEYCGKYFKEKKVLTVHERTHTGEKPYRCEVCGRCFSQRAVLLEHKLTHSDDKPHLCDLCGQGFRGATALKAHRKRHVGVREFQCSSCDKAFLRKNDLSRHTLVHTGQKPHHCSVCMKAFTRASYLKEHMNIHTGAKPFKCPYCTVAYSDAMSLLRHKKKHRTEEGTGTLKCRLVKDHEECGAPLQLNEEKEDRVTNVQIPDAVDEILLNGDETSVQVVIDGNTSLEDLQKLQSLLVSASSGTELVKYSQDVANQFYQVVCVNPDTLEVVNQVEAEEIIIENVNSDTTEL